MNALKVNNKVFIWDATLQGYICDGELIKAQKVNVGTRWEKVNYDKYTLSHRYLCPVPNADVALI